MVFDRKRADLEAKIQFLRRVPIFGALNEDCLQRVASIMVEKSYSRKSIVFHEGDHGDTLYIIKGGRVKIAKVAIDGREKTLTILQPGDFFGEMAIFDNMPRSATAEAIDSDVRLFGLNKNNLSNFYAFFGAKRRPFLSVFFMFFRREAAKKNILRFF